MLEVQYFSPHFCVWFFPASLYGVLVFCCALSPSATASAHNLVSHNFVTHAHNFVTHTRNFVTYNFVTHNFSSHATLTHTHNTLSRIW